MNINLETAIKVMGWEQCPACVKHAEGGEPCTGCDYAIWYDGKRWHTIVEAIGGDREWTPTVNPDHTEMLINTMLTAGYTFGLSVHHGGTLATFDPHEPWRDDAYIARDKNRLTAVCKAALLAKENNHTDQVQAQLDEALKVLHKLYVWRSCGHTLKSIVHHEVSPLLAKHDLIIVKHGPHNEPT